MGSATARALARRGRRVLMVERFSIGYARGSSHGNGRIFRFSYDDPAYVAMAMESLPLWRALESEAGESLLHTTGGLDTGANVEAHAAALRANGAAVQELAAREVRERFGIAVDGDTLFQPDAGVIDAGRAWSAFTASAVRAEAGLLEERTVDVLFDAGDHVEVRLSDGTSVEASAVVVTAGGWARDLLAASGIDLPVTVTRETVAYFEVPRGDRLPTIVDWGDPAVYALPTATGLKVGEHHAGPPTDPGRPGTPDAASLSRIAGWVARRVTGAEPQPHLTETCLYTNTADSRFVLERQGRIVVGSPCSGHGFKFAPLIGERLADLAEDAI
jgi:sarcosine oxidase